MPFELVDVHRQGHVHILGPAIVVSPHAVGRRAVGTVSAVCGWRSSSLARA